MIVIEFAHTDNKSLLQLMAREMGGIYKGEDFIKIAPPSGEGIIKVIDIADELQVLMADVELSNYLLVKRKLSEKRFYILHFDDVYVNDTATFTVDGERLEKKQERHSVARLTSNVFNNTEEISAHTRFKVVKVFFSEGWLKKYLGLDDTVDGLQKYISLKTAYFDMEPLDVEYLKLMDELWNAKKDDPLQNVFLQNRVNLLIERFFTRLMEKMKMLDGGHDIPEEDMRRFMEIERILVNNLSVKPPSITQLAKHVTMSTTRLKKGFKQMYGTGIYSYYQKARLQKAKELLMSGKSVKDTAAATGFFNTTNFNTAFKKEFNMIPSEIITTA